MTRQDMIHRTPYIIHIIHHTGAGAWPTYIKYFGGSSGLDGQAEVERGCRQEGDGLGVAQGEQVLYMHA